MRKQKVLFLCTQNSARSQMAEGFLRHLAGDRFEVMSAGICPTAEIHPCAVEAMSEVGIDISEQYPKGLKTYLGFPKAATGGRTHSPAPEALTYVPEQAPGADGIGYSPVFEAYPTPSQCGQSPQGSAA
jgi:hypothetical protein